jgi:glycosyltransferase involved in cell wall biosynthesis
VVIATSFGIRVIHQPERGYGNAYLKGFAGAKGTYLVMGDADDTYDFTMIPALLAKLQEGYDFVTGSRYLAGGHASIRLAERKGESKLRTFRDGWRSLRMMLIYCPRKVFFVPGFLALAFGLTAHLVSLMGLIQVNGQALGTMTGTFGTIFSVAGFQILSLGLHATTYSWSRRFDPENGSLAKFYDWVPLETGLLLGAALLLTGSTILGVLVWHWIESGYVPLPRPEWGSFGATLVIMGGGTIVSSLFISAMSMKRSW